MGRTTDGARDPVLTEVSGEARWAPGVEGRSPRGESARGAEPLSQYALAGRAPRGAEPLLHLPPAGTSRPQGRAVPAGPLPAQGPSTGPLRAGPPRRLREPEVQPAVAGVEPTAGDHPAAGVETHPLRAVDVGVAEERASSRRTSKYAIGTGIATLTPTMPTSTSSGSARAAPPSCVKIAVPLPYGSGVDELERLVERVHAHDGQHRAEDLVGVDRHLGRDAVEQRGTEKEPVDRRPAPRRRVRPRRATAPAASPASM